MIILRKVSSEAEQPLFTEAFCAEVGIVDATIIQDVQENNFRSLAIIVARKKWKDWGAKTTFLFRNAWLAISVINKINITWV